MTAYPPILGRPDVFVTAVCSMRTAAPIFTLLGTWTRQRPWLDLLLVSGGSWSGQFLQRRFSPATGSSSARNASVPRSYEHFQAPPHSMQPAGPVNYENKACCESGEPQTLGSSSTRSMPMCSTPFDPLPSEPVAVVPPVVVSDAQADFSWCLAA